MPAVVLVGHRHVLRRLGGEPEGPLEVEVEPQPPRRARQGEASIALKRLFQGRQPRGTRAVAHRAHPVRIRLRADRLELLPEEVVRRVVGGHADRHERAAAGRGLRDRQRLGERRGDRYAGEVRHQLSAVVQRRPQADLAFAAPVRIEPGQSPEAAPVAARDGEGVEHVAARHAVVHHGLLATVDQKRERADVRIRAEAPAADEQRGSRAHAHVRRQGKVQPELEDGDAAKALNLHTETVRRSANNQRLMRFRALALLVASFCWPFRPLLAQSAGDEQYSDPFAQQQPPSSFGLLRRRRVRRRPASSRRRRLRPATGTAPRAATRDRPRRRPPRPTAARCRARGFAPGCSP